jgi:PqqA peptide cyclase
MNNEYRPYTLIAELTYRCPLHCTYCSNPADLAGHGNELDADTWIRVFQEAEELGVVQLNLTGGEPLLRADLELLVEEARKLDLYTNLITSGIPLTPERLTRLRALGLDSVQISLQSARQSLADRIAGAPSFNRKLEVMRWAASLALPLTLNVVLHRDNISEIEELVALAERVSAERLELANAQYLGWALKNRVALLPSRGQIERARTVAAEAKARLRGRIEILFVTPDYYATYPKACMEGWGRRFIVVNPEGLALPCHLAHTIPGLRFEQVTQHRLANIWHHSAGFNRFRGDEWLPDPCRTCERRAMDFGGCRCQAFHLIGDAAMPDPACSLAPGHDVIESARVRAGRAGEIPVLFEHRTGRQNPDSCNSAARTEVDQRSVPVRSLEFPDDRNT